MAPDKKSAEKFLTLLDEEAVGFTFQTFDDDKERKDSSLAKVFNGPLDQHFDSLVALSSRGAGVFVTVNQTDLKGRKAENIVAVRAVFQEADRAGLPLPALEPHVVVESSPGKFHRYWLVEKSADLERFRGCMRRMVEDFGSDPNAADVARVLRLPGFPHQKKAGSPHMVRMLDFSARVPFSWGTLIEHIPPMGEQARVDLEAIRSLPGIRIEEPLKIRSALSALDPDCDYQSWLKVGMALHHESGGGGDGFSLWDEWSAKGASYRNGETAYRWNSFGRYKGSPVTLGSLFHMAEGANWNWDIHCRNQLPQIHSILEQTVAAAGGDPESVWSPAFVEAMRLLRKLDPTGYEKTRIRLKSANRRIRLAELDRLTRVHVADEEYVPLATELVELAKARCEFWHDRDGDAYASFDREGHDEHWKLDSKGFGEWLGWLAYSTLEKSPSRDVLSTVVNALTGIAKFDGEEHPVYLRTGGEKGDYWLDLCDDAWRAIHITPTGWSIEANPPIRFVRTQGMRPLPTPEVGGNIDRLWDFLNLLDGDRSILIAWMLEALRPDTPYPVAELIGEQGSAKSATQSKIRALLDPNRVLLRAAPKQREDIFVSARNNAVISYENLSSLSAEYQDALCTLATGGGFSTRKHYTNDEEALLEVKRPVMLNGIAQVITRQDLLDRAISFHLPNLEGRRRTEQELDAEFRTDVSLMFGALLDLFVKVLAELPKVTLSPEDIPRMADFALLGEALYRVLGKETGAFLADYRASRIDAVHRTIEASPVAQAAIEWLGRNPKGYRGNVKGLFQALNVIRVEHERGDYWPRTARGFADAFRRVAPSLRVMGMDARILPGRRSDGVQCLLALEQKDGGECSVSSGAKFGDGDFHDVHCVDLWE